MLNNLKISGFMFVALLFGHSAEAQEEAQGAVLFNPQDEGGYCSLWIGTTVYNSDHVTVLRTPSGEGLLQCLFDGTPVTSSVVYDNLYCFMEIADTQSETHDAKAVFRPNGTMLFSCHFGP